MTNDISTLDGALAELGDLIASNLVTMGVTDADASDGLTTLVDKILDVPVTPVTQTLTLTSDKSILSHYDSDTMTLTATLSGGTVSGQTIEFFNGNTSMGTAQTNSNGVATKTYNSQASGNISFTCSKGNITSLPCTVIDAKYYASNSRIDSEGTAYNNDRKIFASSYTISLEDVIHFRMSSIPTRTVIGVGSTQGSDLTFEKNGSTYNLWRNVLSNSSNIGSAYTFSTEHDFIIHKTTRSGVSNKVGEIYQGDTYIDYWQMGSSINKIRVDKFNNDNFTIEVFVL